MNQGFDVEELRRNFPAMDGDAPARFDGPGGTQVPRQVVEAMGHYLLNTNANAHWHFPDSEATDQMMATGRETFAAMLGGRPDEIVFGPNMTTLAFHMARGLGRNWSAGDEVIVTELDHHAHIAPWQALAEERGVVLKQLTCDPISGLLNLNELKDLIGPRTKLLAITAASNALGTIVDVAAASRLAHESGVLVSVDAVHFAPHGLIDVNKLGADLLFCSPYKFYGPHLGVMWCRNDLLNSVAVPILDPQPQSGPERLESGTKSFESIAGATAAVEWLASISGMGNDLRSRLASSFAILHRHESQLFSQLWNGLAAIKGIHCFGPGPDSPRTATVSMVVDGIPANKVAARLAESGCWASSGNFYALTTAERCGVMPDGWVRLGLAAYSNQADVERVLTALDEIIA